MSNAKSPGPTTAAPANLGSMVDRLLCYSDIRRNDPRENREALRDLILGELRELLGQEWDRAIGCSIDVVREALREEASALTYEACSEVQERLRMEMGRGTANSPEAMKP